MFNVRNEFELTLKIASSTQCPKQGSKFEKVTIKVIVDENCSNSK